MKEPRKIIQASFYRRKDTVQIARELLGKVLCTRFDGHLTMGIITETEAYHGAVDRACHAYNFRRTPRTEVMYSPGGLAYVYLCYGIHHLFNIVTSGEDDPCAVLIRAVEPVAGVERMLERRQKEQVAPSLTAGPGSMSRAMGIRTVHTGLALDEEPVWLEDHGIIIADDEVMAGPRVGIDYAGEDAKLPWRFRVRGSKWVSK